MGGGKRILVVGAAAAGGLAVPALAAIPRGEAALLTVGRGRIVVEEGGGADRGQARRGVARGQMDGGRATRTLSLG